MGSLAAPGISAGSNPPCWNRQGSGNGRRRSIDHSSDPTVGGDRSRSEQRLRRYHLQKRPVILANAGEFSRRRCVSGRNSPLHGGEYVLKHHDSGLVECAFEGLRETGWGNGGRLDRATGISDRESKTRAKRQRLAHQERFTVNFTNAPSLEWKIPLTYEVVGLPAEASAQAGETPATLLMTRKLDSIHNIPADRALKLNVNGAGNYRVEYDELSGKLLLGALKDLDVEDRVNLLSDSWALVQANRAPIALYFELVEKLPASTELAEREQIIHVLDFINRLVSGSSEQEEFQRYARSLLRAPFDAVGWEAKPDEQPARTNLRASLIVALGHLNDPKLVGRFRDRLKGYLANPNSLAPDLRPAVFSVVGRYADESTWNELHQLGLKTMSIEEKQNYYDALAGAIEPKLVKKSLPIALTDELPTSRAVFLVSRVARESGHPGIAWDFARANMKALLAKTDALGANTYAPSLFIFFSEDSRANDLKTYVKTNLPATSAQDVAQAVDEIQFRSEFKARLAVQLGA